MKRIEIKTKIIRPMTEVWVIPDKYKRPYKGEIALAYIGVNHDSKILPTQYVVYVEKLKKFFDIIEYGIYPDEQTARQNQAEY